MKNERYVIAKTGINDRTEIHNLSMYSPHSLMRL